MNSIPISFLQLSFSAAILGIFAWRFFALYKQTQSLYALYFSRMLTLITISMFYPVTIALLMSIGVPKIANFGRFLTPSIAGGVYFGLGFAAMASTIYYLPKVDPRISYLIIILLGAIETTYSILNANQLPTINTQGVINWHMNPLSVNIYNTINGLVTVPLIIGFIYKSLITKAYIRASMLFIGFLLVAIFSSLPHQTSEFASFVFFSVAADIGFLFMFGNILLYIRSQKKEVTH